MSVYDKQYHRLINNLNNADTYKNIPEIECRICFELITNEENKVKPCSCVEGVYHKRCIIDWILQKMRDGKEDYNTCEVCNETFDGLKIEKKSNILSHYIAFVITSIIYSILTFFIVKFGLKYYKYGIPNLVYLMYILFSAFILIILYVSTISCIEKTNYFTNNKNVCPVTYNVITISNSKNSKI